MSTFQEMIGKDRFDNVLSLYDRCKGDAMMFGMSMMASNVGTAESETMYGLCHRIRQLEETVSEQESKINRCEEIINADEFSRPMFGI